MKTFFRKQRNLIDFTLASLMRRPGKNFGLLFVYTLIVFLLASVMLYTHALRSEAKIILAASPEIILQRTLAGRHDLIPGDYLKKMGHIRGVSEGHGRLWGYLFDPSVQANYTLMVPQDKKLQGDDIIIGAGVARARDTEVGYYLSFRSNTGENHVFKISQILEQESELISSDLILVSEEKFRSFFSIPDGMYTDLVLSVRNPKELSKIAEKLIERLPDTRPILRDEILRTYDSIFSWRQGVVFVLLAGAIFAFVIFAWDKASGLSAEERKEIGVLKAIGWETADVIRMKFWEGSMVSFTAFLLGYLGAYAHVFYASASLFEPVLKGWSVLYPEFHPVPFIDGLQVATLFFFTVFPYTVATIIPIWQAAITDPDTVMR